MQERASSRKPVPLTEEPKKKTNPKKKKTAPAKNRQTGKKVNPKVEGPRHGRNLRSGQNADEQQAGPDEEPEEQEPAIDADVQMEDAAGLDENTHDSQPLSVVEEHIPDVLQDAGVPIPDEVPEQDLLLDEEEEDDAAPVVPQQDLLLDEEEEDDFVPIVPKQDLLDEEEQQPLVEPNSPVARKSRSPTPFVDDEDIDLPIRPQGDLDNFDFKNQCADFDLDGDDNSGVDESAERQVELEERRPHSERMRKAMDRLAEETRAEKESQCHELDQENDDVDPKRALAKVAPPPKLDLTLLVKQQQQRKRERQRPPLPPTPARPSSLPPSSPSPQGGDESPTRPPGLPSRRKATLPNAPQTWLDRAEAYQQLQQRGPGEHLRMQPSPATRVLRNRNAAVGVDAKDDDDDDDRSVSDFSTTEADTRARLEKECPAAVDYEEQDEEDFEAMEAETTARAKRKGKSKAVEEDAESHAGEDEEGEPESEEDEDEDEDEGVA
ncbi:hypothetical protein FB45DRAFT_1032155 [Roridomyces roridus]|uniref:Uncharacterized protein n=1 Tax=Roridomyces roridus TaxID=1738132 RepID=A0AAD7BJE3_9AGAR|nr:hypothetical protein FB45DRAFT_1032155 [Roridomyces roridus]